MHKALTYVNLPPNTLKRPGDTITKAEWSACDPPQTEEDIAELEKWGSISSDMDAEIRPEHRPVDPNVPTIARLIEQAKMLEAELGDDAPAEVKKLAAMEHRHVIGAPDSGSGTDGNA